MEAMASEMHDGVRIKMGDDKRSESFCTATRNGPKFVLVTREGYRFRVIRLIMMDVMSLISRGLYTWECLYVCTTRQSRLFLKFIRVGGNSLSKRAVSRYSIN